MNESSAYSESEEQPNEGDQKLQPDGEQENEKVQEQPSIGEEDTDLDSTETSVVLDDEQHFGALETTPLKPLPERQKFVYPIIGKKNDAAPTQSSPSLQVIKRCDVGAIRERNEDSCLVFVSDTGGHFTLLPFGLYIVADGMGGHKNGHVASRIASRIVAHHIINNIYMPLLQSQDASMQAPIQEVMIDAVQAAHAALYNPDPEVDSGTTLTAALILGRRLYVAHVGDTRVYLYADSKLEQITIDHSLVQRLQDVGQLTAEDATFHQYRHVLLRALCQEEEIEVDTYMRLLPKKGRLLLCTDGLCGMITDKDIQQILGKDEAIQQVVDDLFESAMDAGGYDNITSILVEFSL